MARDKNKGRVEFQDSEGTTYYLKMGTNEFCDIQEQLMQQKGFNYSRLFFWKALASGDASQKDLTLEDAGSLMDDLGPVRVKELTDQTALSKANAELEAKQKADDAAAKAKDAQEAGQAT